MGVKLYPSDPQASGPCAHSGWRLAHPAHSWSGRGWKVVHLHVSAHTLSGLLLNHVKLLGFFFVFIHFCKEKLEYESVILKLSKTRPVRWPSTGSKTIPSDQDDSPRSTNFNHRNLCLVQLWFSRSLARAEVIRLAFPPRWWCHLLQGFHGFERFFIGRLNNLVILSLILRLLLGQLTAVAEPDRSTEENRMTSCWLRLGRWFFSSVSMVEAPSISNLSPSNGYCKSW